MTKPFGFEKPLGMRDTLPALYDIKDQLRHAVLENMTRHGYDMLETPALEYYDTVGSATTISERQLFKLLDQQGRTVVLRPDMTAPIARITASSLHHNQQPLRLAYDANVYRAQRREGGHPAEFEQAGVELIGDDTISADAEVIALLASILRDADRDTCHITVGHIGFVNALFDELIGDAEITEQLRYHLFSKNMVAFKSAISQLSVSQENKQGLYALLDMYGSRTVLHEAAKLTSSTEAHRLLDNLWLLVEMLDDYGVSDMLSFDFSLVSHMDYYTGVVYEGYNGQLGFPVASGGRYDELLGKFDHEAPAIGFGVFLDRLVEATQIRSAASSSCCIIFAQKQRRQALAKAAEKRGQGIRTVLQDADGITDVSAFTAGFSEVVDYREQEGD